MLLLCSSFIRESYNVSCTKFGCNYTRELLKSTVCLMVYYSMQFYCAWALSSNGGILMLQYRGQSHKGLCCLLCWCLLATFSAIARSSLLFIAGFWEKKFNVKWVIPLMSRVWLWFKERWGLGDFHWGLVWFVFSSVLWHCRLGDRKSV